MHNRVTGTYILTALVLLLSCLFWSQPAKAATDDCSTGNIWRGYLYNEETDQWLEYLPNEFFNDSLGANIPDYDADNSKLHPYFEMKDTTCSSNNWSIRFTGYSRIGSWGESLAVIGIDVIGYTDNPSLAKINGKPADKPIHLEISDTSYYKHKPIKGLKASIDKYEMGFDYHDDTLFFYRNGYIYRKEAFHICKVVNPTAYWEKWGGWLEKIDYWDYTNGTEYHEDFKDCSNVQTFPECEPQPEVTIEASFDLPDCNDSTLYLSVVSNLLEDFHWEGPNGWTSDDPNPVIDYQNAVSGKYLVWGKLDPCSKPVYMILDIDIPKIKKDSVYQVYTCHGDTVRINGKEYTENGIYIDTLKTVEGCDSIVYSVLDFHFRSSVNYDSICTGSSYNFHGKLLTQAGSYTDTVKVPECNCDSIVTLHLTTYSIGSEFSESICEGSSFEFGGNIYNKAGNYTHTFKTPDGCDSTVTLHLTTYPISSEFSESICEGSFFEFGGTYYSVAGNYTHTFKTPDGCDSTVTLHLTTYPISSEFSVSICEGRFFEFGGTAYSEAGDYKHTFKTPDGCDSTVTLHLTTYPISSEFSVSICEGSFFEFGGTAYNEAGDYKHTFKTPDGCDSTVTLHLTTYAIERDETVTICKGSSYLFGGNELRKAGKYKHTFKTPEGCDSTVTLILQVEEIHSIVNESICQGSSFLFGDTLLKEPGNYKRTFKTPEGCDSTVYLRLTTYPISATIFDTICQGQEYHFNDTVYTKSGIYKQVSKTAGGCDSTTILRLTVTRPGTPTVIPITICKGDSTTYNGHIFSKVGSFRDTLTDQAGCDSFIVYKVSYGYQHDTAFVYRTCVDKPVQIINGEWMSRDTTFTTLMEFDNYECKVKTRITVIAVPSVHLDDTTFLLCGKHHLSVHLDSIPAAKYQWEPTTGVACPTCSNTDVVFRGDSVSYQVSLDNGYCQDTLNVGIVTTPSPIITAAGVNQSGEGLVILVSNGTEPYYYQIDSLGDWHNNIDFEKLDIGVHMAYVKDDKGCIAKKRFSYYVPVIPAKVVTPNGDGILDRWEIKNLELYDEYTIEIYNRWGKCLKTYHNYYDGWDGTYNGHPMPSTDYWYRIVVQLNDQEETGHFTLIRF